MGKNWCEHQKLIWKWKARATTMVNSCCQSRLTRNNQGGITIDKSALETAAGGWKCQKCRKLDQKQLLVNLGKWLKIAIAAAIKILQNWESEFLMANKRNKYQNMGEIWNSRFPTLGDTLNASFGMPLLTAQTRVNAVIIILSGSTYLKWEQTKETWDSAG